MWARMAGYQCSILGACSPGRPWTPTPFSLQVAEGLGAKETPQQRYQRLQYEVQELAREVEQIQVSISRGVAQPPHHPRVTRAPHDLGVTQAPFALSQSTVKEAAAEEELTPMALARQVEGLKQQLVSSHLEKLLGPTAAVDFADPDGALAK